MATIIEYKYYILTDDDTSEENVLFAPSHDVAVEFFNNLFMSVHMDGRTNVHLIELRNDMGELVQEYDTHMEVLNVN